MQSKQISRLRPCDQSETSSLQVGLLMRQLGMLPIHEAQLLTYLKLGGWKVGLLINFNVSVLKNGIRRRVLNFEEQEISAASASLR